MEILITVCARGGSKGIPGKNIKLINGRPLISYTLRTAQQFIKANGHSDLVLSTDDEQIKKVVDSLNFDIDTSYTRPQHLATDKAGKIGVIKDVLLYAEKKNQKNYDVVLDLDVTSPLRNLSDLEKALEMLLEKPEAYNIFSVSPANRNPYFNMVEEKVDGYFALCKKGEFLSRQAAPKVYDMNASFYFYRRLFFKKDFQTVFTDKSLVYEVPHTCFDLDHPIDFEFMSFLLDNNKLDFDL
ncbi:MAG: acylneuraminate cytidylyltransferase family protein [Flavisolibacter sp.]